jgi:hypothetical protein
VIRDSKRASRYSHPELCVALFAPVSPIPLESGRTRVPLSTDKTSYPPAQACATLSGIFTSGVVYLVRLVCLVYLVFLVCLVFWLNETNQMNQINQINKTNQKDQTNQIDQTDETDQTNQSELIERV